MASTNDFEKQSLGNICQNPRGEYDPETVYQFLDAVSYSGGYYMALKNNLAGTAPTANRTDENWFCCSISGQATPEYIAMYDRVVNLAEQVAEDARLAQGARENVSGMEENVRQLQAQAADSANAAEESKDQAAGYARAAESSRQAAQTAEANAAAQVTGFDIHVAEKTAEAEEEITGARRTAVNAVVTQQNTSVQAVKDQTQEYVAQKQNEAAEAIQGIVDNLNLDVAGMKQQVTSEGAKQIGLINDAGTEQLNSVKQAGAAQAKTVQDTGTSQMQAVNDAGTAQVQEINDAGTAQSQAVEQKGQEVLTSIPEDYLTLKDQMIEKSIETFFNMQRTGKVYATKFYYYGTDEGQTTSPAGEKILDNAGLTCAPSTDTVAGQDDYAEIPLFRPYDCNFIIDDSGDKYITKFRGQEEFSYTGKVDVGVLQMSAWWNVAYQDDCFIVYWSDSPHPELNLIPYKDCVRSDGTVAPYMIHSKYISGLLDGVLYSSSGLVPARNQSYNNMITNYAKKGAGYTGENDSDMLFRYIMLMIKYATKSSQSIMAGCTSYNYQYPAVQVETGVKRIILTKTQANTLIIGSRVSIGLPASTSLDRGQAYMHNIADSARITHIEEIDDANSAIYVDTDDTFDVSEGTYLTTMHWHAGTTDHVLGNDGSPVSNTSGKYPMKIQGIECMVGGCEVASDEVADITEEAGRDIYIAAAIPRTSNITTIRNTYKKAGSMPRLTGDIWVGDVQIDTETGAFFVKSVGSGDKVGTGDRYYGGNDEGQSGQREHLQGGFLWNGSHAGFCYRHGSFGLGAAGWGCLSRV